MQVNTTIGDQSYNASHFTKMKEEDAVKAMIADGLAKDEATAKKAYAACVKDVKEFEEAKKKKAESGK